MKKIRQCRICGKESNSYYCCKEHMELWYRNNPRHLKVCGYCGKEFKTNDKKQKYCSRECGGQDSASIRSEKIKAMCKKQNTQIFVDRFNSKVGASLKYISGYDGCDSIIKVQCKICGTIFSYGAQFLRKDKKPNCPHCLKIEREIIAEQKKRTEAKIKEEKRTNRLKAKAIENQAMIIKRTKQCNQCGKTFISFNRNVYCSDKCKKRYLNHQKDITRRHKLKENGKVDYSITLEKLIKRDNNICHICHKKCDIYDFSINNNGDFIAGGLYPSIDHMMPVAKGGTHTWSNIKLAHCHCNTVKSDKSYFIADDGQVTLSL